MHELQNVHTCQKVWNQHADINLTEFPIRACGGQVHCQMSSDILKGIFLWALGLKSGAKIGSEPYCK